jgi:2-iminobutanoate/2-iminopropanoate deaminase
MRRPVYTNGALTLAFALALLPLSGCIGVTSTPAPAVSGSAGGSAGGPAASATGSELPLKEILVPGGGANPLFASVLRSGNLLFLSGVIGRSADGDIEAATRQSLEGVRTRLTQAGATLDDVVKCTVFLIDMADYDGMNRVYAEYFPVNPPARSAVAVLALPVAAQVEVECIAAVR